MPVAKVSNFKPLMAHFHLQVWFVFQDFIATGSRINVYYSYHYCSNNENTNF